MRLYSKLQAGKVFNGGDTARECLKNSLRVSFIVNVYYSSLSLTLSFLAYF